MDARDEGYARALAAAAAALSADPRAGLPLPGTASTLRDVAAHIVACAALRARSLAPERAVLRHIEAGADAIARLSALTGDPAPGVEPVAKGRVTGKVGREWSYNSGFLHHAGESWHLSGTMPGVFRVLPATHPDLDEMTLRFRSELAGAGLPPAVVGRGVAIVGKDPHGRDDGRPWTEFRVPMDDPRLDYSGFIVDLGHKADHPVQESLRTYARQASEVHLNAATLSRMADGVEDLCIDAGDEVPSLRFQSVSLHSVSIGRMGHLKDSVVMHATLTGLSEALSEIGVRAIFTGEIGASVPKTTGLPAVVQQQRELHRAFVRLGGASFDRTGADLMRAAGHDVDAMLARIAEGVPGKRVSAGTSTMAWLSVSLGRITASVAVTPEARWKKDRLEIRREFPESVLASLTGRSVADVIEHDALRDAVVRTATSRGGRTVVTVQPRWEPLG